MQDNIANLAEALSLKNWFAAQNVLNLEPIAKATANTLAWFGSVAGRESFLKFYSKPLDASWGAVEIAIAGGNLHNAIVPLREIVPCSDGTLLLYDRVSGENLGAMNVRARFQKLPIAERIAAVLAVSEALSSIVDFGYMIVDWYEGNMIYDFAAKRIHLFDWELCRPGDSFVLEMDSNYGSSRLMAPEEFVRGSWLDQRTLVFNLGRYALITLPELAEPLAPLFARATYPARSERYATLSEFITNLTAALFSLNSN